MGISSYYTSGELMEYLGVTRDALRFYREKELLKPHLNEENNYRLYTFMDIYRVMAIDFFKKRSLTIKEIQEVMHRSDIESVQILLRSRRQELLQLINEARKKLLRIEETMYLTSDLESKLNVFSIKSMPSFTIKGELKSFDSVEQFNGVENVYDEDMFTRLIRMNTFDLDGIKDTKILVADGWGTIENPNQECIYTMVEEVLPRDKDQDLDGIMYKLTCDYAKSNGIHLLGQAYSRMIMVTFDHETSKSIIEVFIPFEPIIRD